MIFADTYSNALSCTILITLIPIFFVFNMPRRGNLNVWLAFAVGGLLGDAFLHLIPHARADHDHDPMDSPLAKFLTKYSPVDLFVEETCGDGVCGAGDHHDDHHDHGHHDHHHEHHDEHHDHHEHEHEHSDDITQGLWILAGICLFFFMDKTVRYVNPEGGHSHSHGKKKKKKKKNQDNPDLSSASKSTIILNLIGDFVHNFTDGLAIGGTWSVSRIAGITTTIAVLVHEVAHEVGDFAILIQAGMSNWTIVKTQMLTGIGAMIGTVVGVYCGHMDAASWIPSLTAGGFVYIACTSVMPELLKQETSFKDILLEMFAMVAGIGFMILICYIE